MSDGRAGAKRALLNALILAFLALAGAAPSAQSAEYVIDSVIHAPPTNGAYAYYATYGTFGPDDSGFPAVGGTFVEPIFGSTIRRLTNELAKQSFSEIYAKNGFLNADGTLMHHRAPGARTIIHTITGAVVRTGVPGNFDSSFAPDDPDAWYWFSWGGTALNKYKVSTGTSTVVKTFSEAFGQLGGSVDWIDGSGQYMAFRLGSAIRVYDVKNDILYAGSIPGNLAGAGSWVAMSPDGNYVLTAAGSWQHYSFKIDHASKSVSTSPVMFWSLCGDHGDFVSASNGKTYFVTHECHSEGALYAVDVSLSQSNSNLAKQRSDNKKLVQLSSWSDVAGHFSGVSKGALRDWFFTSVNSGDDGFTSPITSWRPYKAEILMINVVTGEVRRLAHHRSRSISSNYYYTPRVSASFDGSVVTWASNFGYSSGTGYVDIYALRLDEATGGATPGTDLPSGTASNPALASPTVAMFAGMSPLVIRTQSDLSYALSLLAKGSMPTDGGDARLVQQLLNHGYPLGWGGASPTNVGGGSGPSATPTVTMFAANSPLVIRTASDLNYALTLLAKGIMPADAGDARMVGQLINQGYPLGWSAGAGTSSGGALSMPTVAMFSGSSPLVIRTNSDLNYALSLLANGTMPTDGGDARMVQQLMNLGYALGWKPN